MADDASDVRDGSDIEADYEPVFCNADVPKDPLEKSQGLRGFFDDTSSEEEEFKGFRVIVFAPMWATPTRGEGLNPVWCKADPCIQADFGGGKVAGETLILGYL